MNDAFVKLSACCFALPEALRHTFRRKMPYFTEYIEADRLFPVCDLRQSDSLRNVIRKAMNYCRVNEYSVRIFGLLHSVHLLWSLKPLASLKHLLIYVYYFWLWMTVFISDVSVRLMKARTLYRVCVSIKVVSARPISNYDIAGDFESLLTLNHAKFYILRCLSYPCRPSGWT